LDVERWTLNVLPGCVIPALRGGGTANGGARAVAEVLKKTPNVQRPTSNEEEMAPGWF
jgi:cell division GTPase FtsZ